MGNTAPVPDPYFDLARSFPSRERTISAILQKQAARYGNRTLLVFGDKRWSYTDICALAAVAAKRLHEVGVNAGDRVALLSGNRPEMLEAYLGCAWLGAIAVPINTAARGAQLNHIFRNARPSVLVLDAAQSATISLIDDGLRPPVTLCFDEGPNSTESGGSWGVSADGDMLPAPPVGPGDTAVVLYTSGTTGPSKGVCCPQAQMFWWGIYSAKALGIREGDVLLTTLPLFHTNALNAFYQALLNGCTYVLEPKFSASGYWAAVRRHEATVGYLLGAMAAILIAQPEKPDARDHKMRVALGGGVPAQLHEIFLQRFNLPLVDGYASTETNFVFASTIPSDHPGSMGYLMPGVQARIVDEDDNSLPDGEAGELLLRPDEPFAFAAGYLGMAEKTVEAWRNLWFHSGDRVVRMPDGHYQFIDRMKDSIRRRGENVSSWEVEQVLSDHPAVASCAVYALPSELGEDEVAAAIQLKPGLTLEPEDLLRHCEGRLAYFALPRFVRFLDALPLTENGKIKKPLLRDDGRTTDIWDREAAGYVLKR